MASGSEHRLRVQLRWRDIDRLGHLNQAVYHELLEEVRAGLLTKVLHRTADQASVGSWVVVRVELDYVHEVRKADDAVDLVARVGHVGATSIRLDHDILLPDGTIAATGCTVLVAWDGAARAKRPITGAEREALGG